MLQFQRDEYEVLLGMTFLLLDIVRVLFPQKTSWCDEIVPVLQHRQRSECAGYERAAVIL